MHAFKAHGFALGYDYTTRHNITTNEVPLSTKDEKSRRHNPRLSGILFICEAA